MSTMTHMAANKTLQRVRKCLALALLVGALSAQSAFADPMNHPLLNAQGALPAFTAQQHFFGVGSRNTVLDVTVDYAVFAPGSFPGSFAALSGLAAPGANDYIYAYQVFNNGPLSGGLSNTIVSELALTSIGGTISSFGHDPTQDFGSGNIGGQYTIQFAGGSTILFLMPPIRPDQNSAVLLLSSPSAPSLESASVRVNGMFSGGQLPMPSPVPAPTALVLGALGLGLVRRFGRFI